MNRVGKLLETGPTRRTFGFQVKGTALMNRTSPPQEEHSYVRIHVTKEPQTALGQVVDFQLKAAQLEAAQLEAAQLTAAQLKADQLLHCSWYV